MNYIELINRFWLAQDAHSLTTTEIALYFYLLKCNNTCQWANTFKRNNAKIGADLGISFNTFKNARNKLKKIGLIDFRTKNGSPVALYTLSKFDEVAHKVSDEVSNEVTTEVYVEVGDELNKIETKQKLNLNSPFIPPGKKTSMKKFENLVLKKSNSGSGMDISPPNDADDSKNKRKKVSAKKEKEQADLLFVLPFDSEQFSEKWEVLKGLQKWKKKPPESLREALCQLAKYPEEFAIELVELAISGNYQAVTYPNTAQKFEDWKRKSTANAINSANYKSNKLHSNPSPGKYDNYRL
jgi:predicted transcriptional regulator